MPLDEKERLKALFAFADGVKLSLTATSADSNQLNVEAGGKSECVRVFAKRAGMDPVPLEFAIVKQGNADPCTGKPPIAPMLDLAADSPARQPYTPRARRGTVAIGSKVTCRHAPGLP